MTSVPLGLLLLLTFFSKPADQAELKTASPLASTTYPDIAGRTTVIRQTTREIEPSASIVSSTLATTRAPRPSVQEVSSTVHIKFNCQRPRTSCADNSTCLHGRCRCSVGYEGYDCALYTESIVTACDPPCLNGGTCYSEADPLRQSSDIYFCYCTEAFHGHSCEKERVFHKCNPDSMDIHVAPIVGSGDEFTGSVYVLGHEADDQCVFVRHDDDTSTFHRLIPFDLCGGAANHTDEATGVTSLSWRVVIRYDDVLLETDQELTFTCYLRHPGATYDWHAWMLAHDNVRSNLPSRTLASDVQPVHMTLLTADGLPVDEPQKLGTSLQLKYTLNGGDVYDSFRIDKVAVSNAMSGEKRHSVTLVSAGCVTDDAVNVKKIVTSLERSSDASSMTLHFKVFKLRYSSQLVFENVLKACRRSVDCRPPNCDESTPATLPSRKKRDVQETSMVRPSGRMSTTSNERHTITFTDSNATLTVWQPPKAPHLRQNDGVDKADVQSQFVDCLDGYVALIAGIVTLTVVIITAVTVGLVCWHRLYKP